MDKNYRGKGRQVLNFQESKYFQSLIQNENESNRLTHAHLAKKLRFSERFPLPTLPPYFSCISLVINVQSSNGLLCVHGYQ